MAVDVASNGIFDDAVVIDDPISIVVEVACEPTGLTGLLSEGNEGGIEGWLPITPVEQGDNDGTVGVLKANPSETSGNKKMPTGNSNIEVTEICQMENRVAAELLGINEITTAAVARSKVLPMSNTINRVAIIEFPSVLV